MRNVPAGARVILAALILWSFAEPAYGQKKIHDKDENEIGAFPVVGGDSDIGVGLGFLGAAARFHKGKDEYEWRIEAGALATYKPGGGRSNNPYQDYYVSVIIPELVKGVRLELRPSFTKETTQGYYGLGNASPPQGGEPSEVDQYARIHPTMSALARFALGAHLFVKGGNYFTYDTIRIYQGTRLKNDLESPNPEVRKILGNPGTHAVDFIQAALMYDTRDDENDTTRGQYHQAMVRVSPGGGGLFPYRYEQLNLTARGYLSPVDAITLSGRIVGDFLFDNPPFYELARFEDTFAFGGVNGVRGIPGQRYYGKIKVFGNLEARFRIAKFKALGKNLRFGVATFFDAGRLWTDYSYHPELDGRGLGLKYGTGAGLRLEQDSTFVIRLDGAWSPDARPIGGYLGVGEIF